MDAAGELGAPSRPMTGREWRRGRKVQDPRKRTRERRRFHWSETALARGVIALLPFLYEAYRALVRATSKRTEIRMQEVWDLLDRGESLIIAVLHEDVFQAPEMAWARGCVTIASFAGIGSAIAKILERAGFVTFRGAASSSTRDRGGRRAALGMFRYLRGAPGGKLVGVTVDGPRGPAGTVKEGVLFLARSTGVPLWVHKTYARRHLRMPSWDRSYVPLPFNHILQIVDGPFALPPDAGAEEVERVRREIEAALARTAEEARRFFEKDR